MQAVATYLIGSFVAGLVLMILDAAAGFRWKWAQVAVNVLYLPPLAALGVGLAAVFINAIWAH